ncbi:hypothetical protein B0T16DRAFT_486630 [Cercophora newfieldiana]|uniref:Uncharacterized protein n=1 Tax=Cercophora newfieldiana TaxID=92897 RepID=A0AA40CZM1_9PEZI|nr:hypothetical protein B0T16DRAFT_486630 [Cercophora newfieldiana]
MPKKSPDPKKLNDIAKKAEHDLNTYQSKTGTGQDHPANIEDAGSRITSKFPGSSVKYGEDVVTSASMNRRIPPEEGGEIDDHKHMIHGSAYLGEGGPEDKTAKKYQEDPGGIDEFNVKKSSKVPRAIRRGRVNLERPDLLPIEEMPNFVAGDPPRRDEIMERGRTASKMNIGRNEYDRGNLPTRQTKGSMYKGRDWIPAEKVEDENSMMGIIPPESVVYPSKRSMMQ